MPDRERVQRYTASSAEKEKRKARGDKLRADMRKRQAAGNTSASSGKYTPQQRAAVLAPEKKPSATNRASVDIPADELAINTPSVFNPAPTGTPAIPELGLQASGQPKPGMGEPGYKTMEQRNAELALTKPTGFENVKAVLNIAANPFNNEIIAATTGNETFDAIAGWIANNAYSAAGIIASAVGLAPGVRATAGKMFGNKSARATPGIARTAGKTILSRAEKQNVADIYRNAAGRIATNSANEKLGMSGLMTALKNNKGKLLLVGSITGTFIMSEWALGEAMEGMDMIQAKVERTDNIALMTEYTQLSDQIHTIDGWEQIIRYTPGVNAVMNIRKKIQSLAFQWKVNKYLIEDKIIQLQTQGTDLEIADARAEQKEAQLKESQEDYLKMKSFYETREAEARRDERTAERDANARFWAREADKKRDLAEQERIDIMNFWLEYDKKKAKQYEESRPSKLNFGIV